MNGNTRNIMTMGKLHYFWQLLKEKRDGFAASGIEHAEACRVLGEELGYTVTVFNLVKAFEIGVCEAWTPKASVKSGGGGVFGKRITKVEEEVRELRATVARLELLLKTKRGAE